MLTSAFRMSPSTSEHVEIPALQEANALGSETAPEPRTAAPRPSDRGQAPSSQQPHSPGAEPSGKNSSTAPAEVPGPVTPAEGEKYQRTAVIVAGVGAVVAVCLAAGCAAIAFKRRRAARTYKATHEDNVRHFRPAAAACCSCTKCWTSVSGFLGISGVFSCL